MSSGARSDPPSGGGVGGRGGSGRRGGRSGGDASGGAGGGAGNPLISGIGGIPSAPAASGLAPAGRTASGNVAGAVVQNVPLPNQLPIPLLQLPAEFLHLSSLAQPVVPDLINYVFTLEYFEKTNPGILWMMITLRKIFPDAHNVAFLRRPQAPNAPRQLPPAAFQLITDTLLRHLRVDHTSGLARDASITRLAQTADLFRRDCSTNGPYQRECALGCLFMLLAHKALSELPRPP